VAGHLSGAADAQGRGWQLRQSILALGSGGLFGTGPGRGIQKFFFLPIRTADFIFAVVGEELGLVGASLVLAAYAGSSSAAFGSRGARRTASASFSRRGSR